MLRFIGSVTGLALLMVACGGSGSGPDAPAQPTITAGAPTDGATGMAYPGYFFTVARGGVSPFTWSETGALPPGLTLSPTGQLTGTPVTAGSYAFTVRVADSSSPALTATLPVRLKIDDSPLVVSQSQTPPLGVHGTPYSFTFTATGGTLPLSWMVTAGALPPGLTVSPDGVLSGTASTVGVFPITLTVKDALNQSSPATPFTIRVAMARPPAAFMPTGNMTVARTAHTATLLIDGRVLIAGGGDESSTLASAELYDPTSQTFTATGKMTVARSAHSATLLANSKLPNYGKVLVTGGGYSIAELYDPTAGTFAATGSMTVARTGQTATLLLDGRVLIAGGLTSSDPALASAELYDPVSGTFAATGSMTVPRTGQTATLLLDGRVLITGGFTSADTLVASAELYDPVSGTFTAAGSMSEARSGHTATALPDGSVLVTGLDYYPDLFSPGTGTFSVVGELLASGSGTTATLRKDGTVLVAGGRIVTFCCSLRYLIRSEDSTAAAQLFAPEIGGFVVTGSLITARDGHTATLLIDGTVLVAGGTTYHDDCHRGGCNLTTLVLSSAELFK